MQKIILIKYGELTTKKANRSLFINQIYENMKQALSGYNVNIEKNRVRMFIEVNNENIDEIVNIVKNIFGIHSIVICHKVDNNTDNIKNKVIILLCTLYLSINYF